MDFEYDEDGRLVGGQILIGICSPGGGTIDPTTLREYGIYCINCKGKMFYEDPGGYEVRCKSCDSVLAVRAQEEPLN
jgi:hypothetical protein